MKIRQRPKGFLKGELGEPNGATKANCPSGQVRLCSGVLVGPGGNPAALRKGLACKYSFNPERQSGVGSILFSPDFSVPTFNMSSG